MEFLDLLARVGFRPKAGANIDNVHPASISNPHPASCALRKAHPDSEFSSVPPPADHLASRAGRIERWNGLPIQAFVRRPRSERNPYLRTTGIALDRGGRIPCIVQIGARGFHRAEHADLPALH